ncbi:hypothetical protein [Chromobacterium haemolyticum]|uniref:hypothetical protein n=1 Tax=Chromobacterium haemolyticum TaxID=394935 RepID=UPI0011318CDF|nr:hypothetical protein [Chromobacterium haemolyticum]
MGFAVGYACYSDQASAADALYTSTAPRITETGYQAFEKSGHSWQLNNYRNSPDGAVLVSSSLVVPKFAECDPQQLIFDGVSLGWLVLTPAIIVWGILVLKRALT